VNTTGVKLTETGDPSVPPGLGWYEIALAGAPFQLGRFTVAPGLSTPVDVHQVHEVWLVAAGHGELCYGGDQLISIDEGDSLYIKPNHTHTVTNTGDRTLVVHSIYWSSPC
jgi:mannose-6-phosphate isomerase-like protein (cupin superfamily)